MSREPRPARPGRRVRVPTILQMEAAECGAAALGMVLAYRRLWLPLEMLRELCGISRDGASAAALARAARSLGLSAQGWRVEPSALSKHVFPAVAFWEMNRFGVIEGRTRGGVAIKNPAQGRRVVNEAQFDRAFTGVLLTFAPTPAFRPDDSRPGLFRALLPRGPKNRPALVFLSLVALSSLLPPILVPAASRIFTNYVLIRHATDWLRPMLLLAATDVLSTVLAWLQATVLARLQRRLGAEAAVSLMAHMLTVPIRLFVQRHVDEVVSRTEAAGRLSHTAVTSISFALFSIMGTLTSAGIMLTYDVPMAPGCLVLAGADAAAIWSVNALRADKVRQVTMQGARLSSVALGGIQAIETTKASGAENQFFARLMGAQSRLMEAMLSLERSTILLTLLPSVLKAASFAALLGWGARNVMAGSMTVGTLIAFLAVLQAFHTPPCNP